jgi:COP9 signalosome complex subunit 1
LLLANHKIFHISRYGSCLGYLEKLKSNLLLDIHLHEHLEVLYKDIRHKAIIQYTFPFISVDLNTMAVAFKTTVSLLEKELAALITDNKIQVPNKDALHHMYWNIYGAKLLSFFFPKFMQARIDSHNKILYANHADQRNGTFQRALQLAMSLREMSSSCF